jgi:hypothetical protein
MEKQIPVLLASTAFSAQHDASVTKTDPQRRRRWHRLHLPSVRRFIKQQKAARVFTRAAFEKCCV